MQGQHSRKDADITHSTDTYTRVQSKQKKFK
jgi:hypothetical protein